MKPTRDEQAFADMLEGMRAEAPREVARMAALAAALEHARPAGPNPAFRDALRNRLLAETAVRRPWLDGVRASWVERNARMRRSFRFVFANAVAAAMLLAGGSIMAVAQESVPGDWDYFAKRMHENARLLVTRSAEPRGYLQMELARERLDEVRELVNRNDTNPDHYATALNDMDARTLDATKLLVSVWEKTADRVPLDRLTKFASAQKQGLEVLVDQLPAGARPQARDSIDILERVADRVTGIMGGCLCPANPLVPGLGAPTGSGDSGGGTAAPQGPVCACSDFRGDDQADEDPIAGGPTDPTTPTPDPEPTEDCPGGDCPIDLPELPVVGDGVDDVVNDLIDEVLEPVLEPVTGPSPVPTITLPPLPLKLGG